MIQIAIVEDNGDDARVLTEHISAFCKSRGDKADVKCYSTGFSFLDGYTPSFDIVFRDLAMHSTL